MDERHARPPLPWVFASLAAAALLVVLAGHRVFLAQRADILAQRSAELAAIADLKVAELSRWRMERLSDSGVTADNPFLADALAGVRPGTLDGGTRGKLKAFLDSLKRRYRYDGAAIVEPSGAILVSSEIDNADFDEHLRETLAKRAPVVDTEFMDLHLPARGGKAHIGILQPLGARHLLYLIVDPAVDIYPIIQHWPTPSPSGEVLLVRRDGGEVVYLNELRHRGETALRLRFPLSRSELPAVRAVTGFEGVVPGIDYRGVAVLAALRRVPGTSWSVVAKIDRKEILGPIQSRGRALGLLGALLWLLAAATALLIRRQQRLAHLRLRLAESERHRGELTRAAEQLRAEEDLRRRDLERLENIAALAETTGWNVAELLSEVLERAIALTGSRYGYLYRYDEGLQRFALSSWSRDVMPECAVTAPETVYHLEKTGIWGESVRQRRAIVVNDFAAEHPLKKGYPAGHVALRNFLTIPVFSGSEIVAVLGVANKEGGYAEADVTQLKLLMGAVWRMIERQAATEDLRSAVKELQRSNTELEQFAYIASHDLQEPLRSISSFLQLLERRYPERLDDEGREFIRFAVEGANRLQAMIAGLLAYSRIGKRPPAPGPVDLGQALGKALANLAVAVREAGAVVTCDPLPTVRADGDQVVQLLQNLIDNAIKYRGTAPPRIHVSCEQEAAGPVVRVRDNGIGIAPEHQERIFNIFRRLHGPEIPGAGIGLALCRRIVENAGGSMAVASEPGQGAVFSFTLPGKGGETA